jgi:tetratricopeptide (TPR) repeat protein
MSGLKTIRKLLHAMQPEERTTFRNYLTSFDSRGEKFSSKSVKLLDLLAERPDLPADRDVEFFLYGKRSTMAYSRLLIRFRDKLLESLLLDVNVRREGNYGDYFRYLFEARKKLSYAQIVAGRGMEDLANFLCDSVCETGERFELYEEWLLALRLKMQLAALVQQDNTVFTRLLQRYEKTEKAHRAAFDAYCTYNKWINRIERKAYINAHDPDLLADVERLREHAQKVSSDHVNFYWLYLDAARNQFNRNYRIARRCLEKQLTLVENSRALFNDSRMGTVLLNLADNEIYLHRFDRAVDYCQRAMALQHLESFNANQCMECEFYGHFYSQRFGQARMILQQLLLAETGRRVTFRHGKRQYLLANILFLQGMYRETNDLLLELNAIETDSEGWNVGLRVLLIMTDIERSLHELAGKRIESTRKHLRKLEQQDKLHPRDRIIYEVLRQLDANSYDFKITYQQMPEEFALLKSNKRGYRWEVKTPEMIIFHEWFFAHVIKNEYNQKVPRYIEPDADEHTETSEPDLAEETDS